jgi:hypothetical protein
MALQRVLFIKEIGMLVQDRRDLVPPAHPDATFYTNQNISRIIDTILDWLG